METIEKEVASSGELLPAPAMVAAAPQFTAGDMLRPPMLQRMIVGSWVLITINTLIFGFVIFLPQFFLRQGLTIAHSLAYTVVLSAASLIGCALGARSCSPPRYGCAPTASATRWAAPRRWSHLSWSAT